ncbi:carboxylesterase/lipase family protein [Umezawaea endophytica]|uniref:Carboxylesterase family protein n=1 Tax=Umezawaea endophytica TaxID=1654476 RepID=A0A9X3A2F9_9PSEU|nr:carboxylesterase family protein [Umezawaea endophytica]MCS7479023.1 carboxylesterase family protein [Umezawaea endophytica]
MAVLLVGCGEAVVEDDVVRVETGEVRGSRQGDLRVFQGIPYAAPPRGELRWAEPRRAERWEGTRDATRPGSPCPQVGSSYSDTRSTNEECLFLNVTAPRSGGGKPVMVWIHGDGAIGAGHFFDAARLASRGDVVVVTVNYRMGVFGGFGMPGLAGSGTFGLMDQRAALEWVGRNAAAFGGDPGNVTLFGVSYGATSAVAHLVSERSRGLFHRVALHSAFALADVPAGAWFPDLGALPSLAWRSVSEVEGLGAAVAGELGAADVDALRRLPVEQVLDHPLVMNIFQAFGYGGEVLPKLPGDALAAGEFARVPVLAGATRDEHRSFVGLFRELAGRPVTTEQYPELLATAFGADAPAVEAEYPLSDHPSASAAWAALLTDRVWARATMGQHRLLAAHNPVYAFEFADRGAPSEVEVPSLPMGASHSSDIGYLFPTAEFDARLTAGQRALSDTMIDYWTRFARTGDPNGEGLPEWRPFGDGEFVNSLAPGAVRGVDYSDEHRLAFWAGR